MQITTNNTNSIVAFQFDTAPRGAEFIAAAARMQSEGHLLVHDLVALDATPDGKVVVTETHDLTPGTGAVNGAAWGGLLGLLFGGPILGLAVGAGVGALRGKATDYGISNEFVDDVRTKVGPGKSAVILLVSHVDRDAVDSELERFPGTDVIASNIEAGSAGFELPSTT